MPGAFTGAPNSNFFDLNPWAPWFSTPGEGGFRPALAYYLSEIRKNDSGAGLPALAAGRAAAPAAQAYQSAMASPSALGDAYGVNSFADLFGGQTASRGVGRGVQSSEREKALSGIDQSAMGFANSMAGTARSEMALNQAQASQDAGNLGLIGSILDSVVGLGSEFLAPGNPFGLALAGKGLFGSGGAPGITGAGTPYGSPVGPSSSFGTGTGPFSLGYGPTSSGFMSTIPPTSSGASFGWGSNLGPFSLMGGTP